MKSPFIIAGPCSAESREQVLSTASRLQGLGVDVLRAGVWKQRTRPGTFEGAGAEALEWLAEAKQRYGFRTGCEVFSPEQLRLALEAGMKVFWIGARAVSNPVIVQEVADALGAALRDAPPSGAGLTVLLKNPPSPDLELWAAAFERFLAVQTTAPRFALGAILRGVTPYLPGCPYRNDPAWQMGLDLRERFPRIPLYFDPSHVAGDASLVPELSRRAIALGFDGLMVEVHCNPSEALSDAAQQLTPSAFASLLESLADVSAGSLARYREEIDVIDGQLLSLLGRRMFLSEHIGRLKAANAVSPLQAARWEKVMGRAVAEGRAAGLSESFVREIFEKIHAESLKCQG